MNRESKRERPLYRTHRRSRVWVSASVAALFLAGLLLGEAGSRAETSDNSTDAVRGRVELPETVISGDTGTPKVINIIPWKDERPGQGDEDLRHGFRDEILSPIDPDDFTHRYGEETAR